MRAMPTHKVILLVEADPRLLDSVGFALRRRGYHLLTAGDGNRAAELIARNPPDAVVLGMLLPGQSGFQVTRLVKEQTDGAIPVVMLSDHTAAAHHDYALAVGVERFLVRPFTPADVVAAVEELCPLPTKPGSGTFPSAVRTPG